MSNSGFYKLFSFTSKFCFSNTTYFHKNVSTVEEKLQFLNCQECPYTVLMS